MPQANIDRHAYGNNTSTWALRCEIHDDATQSSEVLNEKTIVKTSILPLRHKVLKLNAQ
jgi:hypothetical protein